MNNELRQNTIVITSLCLVCELVIENLRELLAANFQISSRLGYTELLRQLTIKSLQRCCKRKESKQHLLENNIDKSQDISSGKAASEHEICETP
jgi:hypothetical protein